MLFKYDLAPQAVVHPPALAVTHARSDHARSDHARTIQILTALNQHNSCLLSETAIASNTNEAKTAVEFLKSLILQGKTVVGDAGFCHRDICETILSDHGEYLILVKANQLTASQRSHSSLRDSRRLFPLYQAQSV